MLASGETSALSAMRTDISGLPCRVVGFAHGHDPDAGEPCGIDPGPTVHEYGQPGEVVRGQRGILRVVSVDDGHLDRLAEAGEEGRVRERHLAHFIALGEATTQAWSDPAFMDAASQARRLNLEFENVRSAYDWAAETGRVDEAVHLIEAFWTTLFIVRPVDLELRRWLQRLVTHPAARRTARLGWAYLMIWELYFGQDAYEEARAANEQAREIGLALGDTAILAKADYQRALHAQEDGDYMLARSIFDRLRAAGEQMPNGWPFIYGCLLYTSPSPRDRTRSRMPSFA